MFQDNLSTLSSKANQSKRDNTTSLTLNVMVFFGDFAHLLIVDRIMMFQKLAVFPFSGNKMPNLAYPLD